LPQLRHWARNYPTGLHDGNGNLAQVSKTSGSGAIVYDATTWWVANLAKRISQGGTAVYSDFWYGPSRERIQQTAKKSASVTETTLYVGGVYEKVTRGATVEHVHYIPGGGGTVAVWKRIAGGSTEVRYLHRDHQGSVVAATDYQGTVLERYSYDAWGKRRDPGTWVTPAVGTFSFDPAFNDRGYTGHEHIDHLGLVNMNGRVYDPEIGRFLSADPFVQFPESTQGANRFTYVGNNPLSYADPSGYFSLKEALSFAGIIFSIIAPGLSLAANAWLDAIMKGFCSGFLSAGGDLKAGLIGALGGVMFMGTHKLADLGRLNDFGHAVAKGIAGGSLSALGGDKFEEGFLGAFAGGYLGDKVGDNFGGAAGTGNKIELIKRVMRDSVIGGTAATLGGGKFRNGAVTAAFGRLYNDEALATREAEQKKELELQIKARIGEVLSVDASSNGDLSVALKRGEIVKMEINSDGGYKIEIDKVLIGQGQLEPQSAIAGIRYKVLAVNVVVDTEKNLQFVGSMSLPRTIFGIEFSASVLSPSIDVESEVLTNSGLLGIAARSPWQRRERIERCSVNFDCGSE